MHIRIMDRYVARQFLQAFVVCFVSLTGLYIVIDAFAHLDELMAHARKQQSLLATFGQYYGLRSLVFFERTSGILALVSAMFTVTWIQRYNELTALMAAGIAKSRALAPVIAGAVAVSLLAAASREWVLPRVRDRLVSDPRELSTEVGHPAQGRYDQRNGLFLDGERVVPATRQVIKPRFRLPGTVSRNGYRIEGTSALYQPATATRPAGYLIRGLAAEADSAPQRSLSVEGTPVILVPGDTPWLEADQCFVVSDVEPELLRAGRHWQQHASTFQLIRGLANPSVDLGADVRVAIHTRLLQPFLDTTLLLIGLPLVISRDNRNMFKAVGLAICVVALFMLVVIVCQFLGSASFVSAAFAAWLPLMIFVPLAVATARPITE